MTLEMSIDLRRVRDLMDGRVERAVKDRVASAMRQVLRGIEADHKKQEFRRGSGPPIRGRVTWRTGELARSYRIWFDKAKLEGVYGSELLRAPVLEDGTRTPIKPKAPRKWLTIPTGPAANKAGARAEDYPGLKFRPGRDKDHAALVMPASTSWGYQRQKQDIVYFWLVKEVSIPPRRMLARTAARFGPIAERRIGDAAEAAIAGEGGNGAS